MKYAIFTSFALSFVLSVYMTTPHAYAQLNQMQTQINVEMIPENPGPNQNVSVSLTSYITNIDNANITWRVNSKTIKSGKGQKTFSFTTGNANTTTTLGITILTAEGETITKSFSIKPTQVDLIWQAESFTPPFYKGKAMFTWQNKITFIAVPHIFLGGVEISPKNLVYKWSNNGSVVDYASGYGKNTYTFTSPIISRAVDITVEVSSGSTNSTGLADVTVGPGDPSIVFYRKDPLYGIEFQKALASDETLEGSKEITVVGMPFFFGTKDSGDSSLSYKWEINGSSIGNDPSQNTEVFRQKDGTSGTSKISLEVSDNNKILELANNSFNLNFGQEATTQTTF